MKSLIPWEKETNLFRFMDDIERSLSNRLSGDARFRVDISEKDNGYLLEAELPGFDREDINVELQDKTLVINAIHKSEKEEKDKDGKYMRRERYYGSFSRSFDVSEIDVDKIKADYKNGVLELDLPKQKPENRESDVKKIEIGRSEK